MKVDNGPVRVEPMKIGVCLDRFWVGLVFLAGFTGFFAGCSSGPQSASGSQPAWVHQPTRTVEGGYIIYVGTGDDVMADRAQLKAESQAVEDLANECSFVPKGSRTEDRFLEPQGRGYRAYAKVAIEFADCEQAKRTNDPQEIKKLANERLTKQLADYQNLAYDDTTDNNTSGEGANPALASNTTPSGGASSGGGGGGAIGNQMQFFAMRQTVAYYKEVVVLSPPNSYQPGSAQTTQFTNAVTPATTQIQTYETANPSVRTSPQTWSTLPQRPSVNPPANLRAQAPGGGYGANRARQGYSQKRQGNGWNKQPQQQRRRRRRWHS